MSTRSRRIVLTAIVFVLAMPPAFAKTMVLVRDGDPAMTIVTERDPDAIVLQAAKDLQHYVKKMCGVELPLQTSGDRADGPGIYIGRCGRRSWQHLPPAGSNPETFSVAYRGDSIYLTAYHLPAIAFAAVSFIEDELGVRWFAPGELWEYVPDGTPGELSVDVTERVVVPDWSCRVWSGHGWTKEWNTWLLHNKAVCIPPVPFRNMQNHIHTIFAPEKFAESHPEYYPLIDGKRWIPEPGERAWRPCEGNPDVVRITVEAAREYLDAHPEHNSFSLAMDDIYRLCGCPNCCAMDASPDGYKRKQFSDRHYKFVNAVARELAKTHPDKYIGTLCYHIARELPETVPELEPNVFISMTQRCGEWFRPERKARDMELTKAWRKRCRHMSRYDYLGLGFITPRVFPHAMAEGMKFDHELGFESVYNECYTFLPNTAPMMWMIAKLQWDTDLDADDLLDEFYDCMFGDAAKTMRKYYETLEESWMTERPGRSGWGHRRLPTQACAMSVKDIERAEKLADKAKRKTNDPAVIERIDIVKAGLQYGAYVIRAREITDELAKKSLDSKRSATATLDALAELDALGQGRTVFWADALKRDDILGDTLRGLKGKRYFVADNVDEVDARGPVLAALDALHDFSPDAALDKARALASTGQGALADLAGAWLSVKRGNATNLAANPGFEEADANEERPEADWETEGAPSGWSVWHRAGDGTRFYTAKGKGVDDTIGAGIEAAGSACYLQTIDVKPGQRYMCTVRVRRWHAGMDASGRLAVRWRTADGAWYEGGATEPSTTLQGTGSQWQPMALIAEVPEGATSLVLMLSAQYLGDESAILFDNAAVYRLPDAK